MLSPVPAECGRESGVDSVVSCFTVAAFADPGVMSRALELFVKRGLVPSSWHSRRLGPREEELTIDIQVVGLSPPETRHIAACLRQIPHVGSVFTHEREAVADC